jgi:hypothetical protein
MISVGREGIEQGDSNSTSEVRTMKIQEVRARAKELGLKGTFGLSKAELIRRIQRAEGNFDCFGTATDHCDQSECCFMEDCLNPSGGSPKR